MAHAGEELRLGLVSCLCLLEQFRDPQGICNLSSKDREGRGVCFI